jgi:hypothetical protein
MFWVTGRMPNYLASCFAWMNTEPYTDVSFLIHTPEQEKLDRAAELLTNTKDKQQMRKKIMRYMMGNGQGRVKRPCPATRILSRSSSRHLLHERVNAT